MILSALPARNWHAMNIFIDKQLEHYFARYPLTLVDVGASGGLQKNWSEAERFLKVIGFEPDSRSNAVGPKTFENINLEYGLSNKKTAADFYLTRSKTKSSFFKPNFELLSRFPKSDFYEVVGKRTIECDTLDNQLNERGIKDVDFIKIDTQGSELFILEGAKKLLAGPIFGIEVEVEFAPMYENQPLFAEVDSFITKCGFQLFDLAPCYWKRKGGRELGGPQGQLIYADALYFKNDAAFNSFVGILAPDELKRSKVLRALSVSLLYGYFDYALALFDANKKFFGKAEAELIDSQIKNAGKKYGENLKFPGQELMAQTMYKLWELLKPKDYGWRRFRYKPGNRASDFISQ